MKVLFLCHRFPFPPKRGGKIRPFNIIRHLGGYARVTVASLVRSTAEAEEGAGITPYCDGYLMERIGPAAAALRMVGNLPTPVPSSFGYFRSPALGRRLRATLATHAFDLVFVHCSSAAQYVDSVQGLPKILDFGDMDSEKWRLYAQQQPFPVSLGYRLEAAKLRRVERELAAAFDLSTCTTRAELATLRELGTARDTDWFPNGVDSEFFAPATASYDANTICFAGRMDYFPNQQAVTWYCHEVLPRVRVRESQARFLVIGAAPPPAIRRLAELPGVTVTGTVADVRPHVRSAAVSVAPLMIARGTQNKILESMSMGVPVIASPAAAQGVDVVAGEHLLTAQGAEEFTAQTLRVLQEPVLREQLSRKGRERVLSHHSWDQSMRRLDGIIERCLRTWRSTRAAPGPGSPQA